MINIEVITILTTNGPVEITAFRVAEHFAIHDPIGESGVAVTHIATGYRCFLVGTIGMAIETANALARIGDVWDFTSHEGSAKVRKEHGKELLLIADAVAESNIEALRESSRVQ